MDNTHADERLLRTVAEIFVSEHSKSLLQLKSALKSGDLKPLAGAVKVISERVKLLSPGVVTETALRLEELVQRYDIKSVNAESEDFIAKLERLRIGVADFLYNDNNA